MSSLATDLGLCGTFFFFFFFFVLGFKRFQTIPELDYWELDDICIYWLISLSGDIFWPWHPIRYFFDDRSDSNRCCPDDDHVNCLHAAVDSRRRQREREGVKCKVSFLPGAGLIGTVWDNNLATECTAHWPAEIFFNPHISQPATFSAEICCEFLESCVSYCVYVICSSVCCEGIRSADYCCEMFQVWDECWCGAGKVEHVWSDPADCHTEPRYCFSTRLVRFSVLC